jgi:hypothetical protein
VKLKLSQIIEAQEPLKRLAAEKYPAHIAYRIQRNIRVLAPEALAYEKARMELIKNKYGVELKGEGVPTGSYRVPPEKVAEYTGEIQLLLDEEMDLNIMLLELESIREISPLDLMALEWMFDVSSEQEEKPAGTYRQAHRVRQANTRPEAERADGV